MNILLTGATGLVGGELGIELVRRGHTLFCVVRDPRNTEVYFPTHFLSWNDISGVSESQTKTPPTKKPNSIDAVIHLAGAGIADASWSQARKKEIISSRVDTTLALRKWIKANSYSPQVWINASATGFYGDRHDIVCTVKTPQGSGFLSEVCKTWEDAATGLSDQLGNTLAARTVLFRIGVVFARGGGFLAKLTPLFRTGLAGKIGSGNQWMSWIHISDLVSMIADAIQNPKWNGTFNAVSPNPVTNSEFTKEFARRLKRPAFFSAPSFAIKLAMGESSALALASTRAVSSQGDFKFSRISDALADICDFEYRPGVSELYERQWVPRKLSELFPFFSSEKNLEILIPDHMRFRVLRTSTASVQNGTLIDYKFRIHGFPARWRTLIATWNPPHKFVDTQLKGPYALWHHTHTFEELGSGTLLSDRVLYKLPLWPFGEFMKSFIRKDVHNIFSYRRKKIKELFGEHS